MMGSASLSLRGRDIQQEGSHELKHLLGFLAKHQGEAVEKLASLSCEIIVFGLALYWAAAWRYQMI